LFWSVELAGASTPLQVDFSNILRNSHCNVGCRRLIFFMFSPGSFFVGQYHFCFRTYIMPPQPLMREINPPCGKNAIVAASRIFCNYHGKAQSCSFHFDCAARSFSGDPPLEGWLFLYGTSLATATVDAAAAGISFGSPAFFGVFVTPRQLTALFFLLHNNQPL